MIDAIANSVTGPAIVHDEEDLEGAVAFLLDDSGRCAVMRADGSLRTLHRQLEATILSAMTRADSCPIIRMSGRKVASMGRIDVTSRG